MTLLKFINDRVFYGWIIVATFFLMSVIIFGVRMSFGVFFKSIESEFLLSRAATSAIFSTHMALGAASAIIGGWALDRYGPKVVMLVMGIATGLGLLLTSQTNAYWQLFITLGILLSIGSGAIFAVLTSTISRWFDRKRTFALGIAQSGAGFGTMAMAPLVAFLIATFDWRMSYLILGLLAWVFIMPLSRLLKKEPGEVGILPDGATLPATGTDNKGQVLTTIDLPLARVLRTSNFWFFLLTAFSFGSCLFLISTHLVPHATDIGISTDKAATLLSLMGGSAIAGRLLMGIVADRIGKKLTAVICISLDIVALLWLLWAKELWSLYLFALVYGFGQGGFSPAMSALLGDTFGLRRIGSIIGFVDVGFSIGSAVGPLIGGLVFDISNSYSAAFLYGASVLLMAGLLISLVKQKTGIASRG